MTDTAAPADTVSACRRLWAEVLLAAIHDAQAGDGAAIKWFRSADYRTVSALAGIDPDAAADFAKVMLALPIRARKPKARPARAPGSSPAAATLARRARAARAKARQTETTQSEM